MNSVPYVLETELLFISLQMRDYIFTSFENACRSDFSTYILFIMFVVMVYIYVHNKEVVSTKVRMKVFLKWREYVINL
jgi:hypothetical protein